MGLHRRDDSPHWIIEFVYRGVRYKRSSGVSRRTEAQAIEATWREELRREALHGPTVRMTLSEALERYYHSVLEPRGKPESARRHLDLIYRLLRDLGPETDLAALTAPVISRWRDRMLQGGRKPATVNRHLDVLKAALNRAAREWGVLAVVPYVRSLPEKNQRTRFLSAEEEERLLAASSPPLRDLIVVLLGTGARVGELLDLRWSGVDLERPANGIVFFLETKSDRPRGVPLTRAARQVLERLRATRARPDGHVFAWGRGDGSAVPFDAVKTAFRRARARSGLADVTLHTLRHTYASRLVMRGVSLYQVQRLLGHATPIMTQRYAHLAPEGLGGAVAVLNVDVADSAPAPAVDNVNLSEEPVALLRAIPTHPGSEPVEPVARRP